MANNIIKRVWNQNKMVNIEALQGMAFQEEDGGHTFEISGVDDTGAAVSLSGTVAGVFRRPDNADIALTGAASDGKVYVTLTDDCYAVPGRFALTIFVTADSKKTAVYAAIGTVTRTSGGAVAGDTPQDVVDLINAINSAVATIPADYTYFMSAISPTYSDESVYAVGAYAWYGGILYRCTTTITEPESWTASHWKRAYVCNDIMQLSDVVNHSATPKGSVNLFDYARDVLDGKYVSYTTGAITTLDSYGCYYMIPVNPGQSLFVTSWLNNAHIAFYDCFEVFVGGIARNPYTDAHAGLITIPSNVYFMSFSYAKAAQDESGGKVVCVPVEYYSNSETEYDIPYTGKHLFDAAKKCNRNLIDNNLGFIDAYYNYQTGNLATVANYNAIELPAMAETKYYINDTSAHIAFMDEYGQYMSGVVNVTSFTTPAGCGYLRIGFRRIIGGETATPFLIADDSGNCVYSQFGVGDVYTVDRASAVLTVGVGQKYQTIAAAISDASDGDTILIYPGTYTESLNAYSKEIHIRGVSKAGCVLTYSADNYYYPPLHMAKGTCENLTIKATWAGDTTHDRAYCVHIDNDNEANKTLTFENVDFISERGATVGIGLRSGCRLSFRNCTFRTTDSAVEGPIYLHDSELSPYENQNVEFINCLIINESVASSIKMQSQEHLDKCCKVTYINNKVVQPNNNGTTIIMILYGGRTLTNTNYLGSSDFVLTSISALNSDPVLDYE